MHYSAGAACSIYCTAFRAQPPCVNARARLFPPRGRNDELTSNVIRMGTRPREERTDDTHRSLRWAVRKENARHVYSTYACERRRASRGVKEKRDLGAQRACTVYRRDLCHHQRWNTAIAAASKRNRGARGESHSLRHVIIVSLSDVHFETKASSSDLQSPPCCASSLRHAANFLISSQHTVLCRRRSALPFSWQPPYI